MSGTPWRQALVEALALHLARTVPATGVDIWRRAEVSDDERPRLLVMTGEARMGNEAFGEKLLEVEITVMGYPAALAEDAEAGRALAEMEQALTDALHGTALAMPSGEEVASGLVVQRSVAIAYGASESAPAMGEVTVNAIALGVPARSYEG